MRSCAWLLCLLLPLGCTSPRLLGDGPYDSHEAPVGPEPGGLRYYVGKDVLILTGIRRDRHRTLALGSRTLEQESSETSSGTVALRTVPDTDHVFRLEIQPGGTSDDTLEVKLRGGGILESVNVSSQSKAREVLKNIATFAGTLVGTALGSPAAGAAGTASLPEAFADTSPGYGDLANTLNARLKNEMGLTADELAMAQRLVNERLARLTTDERFVVGQVAAAQALLLGALARETLLAARQRDRADLERLLASRAADAWKTEDVANATTRLSAIHTAIKTLAVERDGAQAGFAAELARCLSLEGAGVETQETAFERVVEIPDIPSTALLCRTSALRERHAVSELHAVLADHPAMRAIFTETGVLLTLTCPPEGVVTGLPALGVPPCGPTPPGTPECTGRVYYRQSYPAVLSIWVRERVSHTVGPPDGAGGGQQLGTRWTASHDDVRLASQRVVEILDPRARVEHLAFEPIAFARHGLGLTFDDKSRILGVRRETTSSAEGLTGALTESISSMRDEIATTLARLVEIEESRRAMALSALETRVKILERQKALVDARLALQGATASADLLAEKQLLEQELAALEAQRAAAGP